MTEDAIDRTRWKRMQRALNGDQPNKKEAAYSNFLIAPFNKFAAFIYVSTNFPLLSLVLRTVAGLQEAQPQQPLSLVKVMDVRTPTLGWCTKCVTEGRRSKPSLPVAVTWILIRFILSEFHLTFFLNHLLALTCTTAIVIIP